MGHRETTASRARANESPVYAALDRICGHLERGRFLGHAAELEGVTEDMVRSRMADNDDVRARIITARAKGEEYQSARLDTLIDGGAPVGGQTWLMERLYPKRYHLPQKLQVGGDPDGVPLKSETTTPTEAELRARLAALQAKLGAE